MTLLSFVAICLLPAAIFKLIALALQWWSRYSDTRPSTVPAPDEHAVRARYSKDLRRLATEHDQLMSGDQPARAMRLRAVELAYDDTLRHACAALHLEAPQPPLDGITRMQTEADLVLHGLSW